MGRFEKRVVNAAAHSRRVAEAAVRRLQRVPSRAGWRYLDVGCGNGLAPRHVADTLGLRVVGVDVDPAQIELARSVVGGRADVSFVTASAMHLPFATGLFNIVATNKVLHHVADRWRALDELQRVVAQGGYLVFADLIVPAALAPLLRRLSGFAGVLTLRDLERAFGTLHRVHERGGWLHYEAVFTKS